MTKKIKDDQKKVKYLLNQQKILNENTRMKIYEIIESKIPYNIDIIFKYNKNS